MKSIFVSSTFKDMQAERNLIHFQIMPEINKFLKDYNQTIEFTDLRWGIDTTEYLNSSKKQEGEEKVLKICLEEIQKTPYFIVILGERYGWVPDDKDIIEHVIDILNTEKKQNYKLQDNKISVTHLEIDYGAFFRKHPENCLFYFREPLPQNKMKNHRIRLQNGEEVPVKEIYISQNFKERRRLENLKKEIEEKENRSTKYVIKDNIKEKIINIENFRKKAIDTLAYEDIKNYLSLLPEIDRIYNVEGYENVEKLHDIYEKAYIFIEENNDETLFTDEEVKFIQDKIKEIDKSFIDLKIALFGPKEEYLSLIESKYQEYYDTVYDYRKYQYIYENTIGGKREIIDKIEKFCKNQEELLKEKYENETLYKEINYLYKNKRKRYYAMVEDNVVKLKEKSFPLQKLLLEIIIKDDLHCVNDIYRHWTTLTDVIIDREEYINLLIKEHKVNEDKNLLENIYQEQDYFVTDCNTICKMVDEQFLYEKAIKNIEEIIYFQKETRYLEKIEEYQNTLGKLKEELKNFCN